MPFKMMAAALKWPHHRSFRKGCRASGRPSICLPLLAIAENSKLDFVSFTCNSKGKLEQVEGKFMMTEVLLEPIVTIMDERDRERALKVLQKSEANCLITNSVKAKVEMNAEVRLI
jgi:organic hydroperoxide reductase OsmC/OhrA